MILPQLNTLGTRSTDNDVRSILRQCDFYDAICTRQVNGGPITEFIRKPVEEVNVNDVDAFGAALNTADSNLRKVADQKDHVWRYDVTSRDAATNRIDTVEKTLLPIRETAGFDGFPLDYLISRRFFNCTKQAGGKMQVVRLLNAPAVGCVSCNVFTTFDPEHIVIGPTLFRTSGIYRMVAGDLRDDKSKSLTVDEFKAANAKAVTIEFAVLKRVA